MENKAIALSGGAAHCSYWAGYLAEEKKEYDVYIGTSGGGLIALFLAAARLFPEFYRYLVYEHENTSNREMYGIISPIDKNGKFREKLIALYFTRRRNYLFDMSKGLNKKIVRHFKKKHFDALFDAGIEVIVTSNNIDIIEQETKYISNLDEHMTYELFVKYVLSTAAIPLLSKPIDILGFQHGDGGITDNNPTKHMDKYDEFDLFMCSSFEDDLEHYKRASTKFQVLMHSVMKARLDQARDDIGRVDPAHVFRIPNKLGFNSADFNPKNMRSAVRQGQEDYRNKRT